MVRRLPVLQQSAPEDQEAEQRPHWQWVFIGSGLAATLWLPLLLVALPFGALPALGAFALACLAAGALVGRFGRPPPVRTAALGPAFVGVAAWLFALVSGALEPWPVALFSALALGLTGALFGALGGFFGQRRRPRS